MRRVIADKVLISDNEINYDLDRFCSYLQDKRNSEVGLIFNTPPEDTIYTTWQEVSDEKRLIEYQPDNLQSEEERFFDLLMKLNMIPVMDNHRVAFCIHVHEMLEGGKMAWHDDGKYSLAVSIYLTEPDGGALEVIVDSQDGVSSNLVIKAQKGRAVVVKGETPHRVLEVKKGPRKSLQVFIIQSPRQ